MVVFTDSEDDGAKIIEGQEDTVIEIIEAVPLGKLQKLCITTPASERSNILALHRLTALSTIEEVKWVIEHEWPYNSNKIKKGVHGITEMELEEVSIDEISELKHIFPSVPSSDGATGRFMNSRNLRHHFLA